MGAFIDWLREKEAREAKGTIELNEVKKEVKDVSWSSGFGKGVGKFSIDEEKYEIEFDEFIEEGHPGAIIKFFRVVNGRRVKKYTDSKEPLTVSLTMKDQVKKYLDKYKPDIFAFLGDLDEKPRLRHYERLLTLLYREYNIYEHSFTIDKQGDRIFVLSKTEKLSDRAIEIIHHKFGE